MQQIFRPLQMEDEMPTIMDVAQKAGVSRSTVSLVINKSPPVKAATREKVEQVIREINYVPNSNARGLSARVTNNLGIVVMQDFMPGTTQISYDNDQHIGICSLNLSNGIMAGLIGTDYGVITERFCSLTEPDALPRIVREKRVDGLFVVGTPYSEQFIPNLRATGLPFVMVGVGSFEEGVDSIYADPREGTRLAVRKMIETGHRNICLMNCPARLITYNWRLEGYRAELEAHGLPFRESWNLQPAKNNGSTATEAIRAFWEAGNRPDAIVTANGQAACGAMAYLYEIGVRIPDDVSIIAYEDSSVCGYATPALTAVNIRKEELGSRAAQCLIERIQNPDKEPEIITLEPFMVYRNSVKQR